VAATLRYTLIDLFAGCGGMTRGFVDSGRYEPVFAVEMDEHAARTYSANFGVSHVEQRKIEDVEHFPRADVVVGGPPCQGFSLLNREGVGFERRALWQEYLRALRESRPAAFVMENVPQLLTSREYLDFKRAAERSDPATGVLGYRVEGRILNAADFGVPQRRRRAIVIGVRSGEVPWPEQTHWDPEKGVPLGGEPWRTFAEAVEGLPLKPSGEDWHNPRNPRPETLIRYRHVPHDGGNRFQMQAALEAEGLGHLVLPCWRNKPTGTTDVFGRLFWKRPAYTIRTEFYKPEKGRYLHPSEDRPITIREAARCMSFPDDFIFPTDAKWTEVARQIGNAVPPLLAERIADSVASALDSAGATVAEAAA
jgi:DNA (cytosine-5)-methyltransferase 1